MPKSTWIFASILSALLLLGIGFLQVREAGRARAAAEDASADSRRFAEQAAATNAALAAEVLALREQATELEQQVARAAKAQQGLEQQMRAELDSRDVTISELQGKLWGGKYRGQLQDWYLCKFLGRDSDVDIATKHPEFNAWKWVAPAQLPDLIVPFKRDMYRAILAGFGEWL